MEAKTEDGDAGRDLRVRRRWPRWCRPGHRDASKASRANKSERSSHTDSSGDAVSSCTRPHLAIMRHSFAARISSATTATRVLRARDNGDTVCVGQQQGMAKVPAAIQAGKGYWQATSERIWQPSQRDGSCPDAGEVLGRVVRELFTRWVVRSMDGRLVPHILSARPRPSERDCCHGLGATSQLRGDLT